MVITGVLLQVAESEASRTLWAWAHGLSSLVWAGAYLVHQLRRRGRRASVDQAPDSPELSKASGVSS
ncbi:MAG: hypothetical protein ACPGPE_05930, partial [Planctomycetota bacterium]